MKHQRVIDHRIHKQQGFTLLELLVALVLVLVLVVSVQRYIAGVSVDHEYLSQRHDDVTQVRIALSNIQRDVAQAGYFPYASDIDSNAPNAMPVGIFYSKNQLRVTSYQPRDTAKDCNGAQKQYVQGAANQGLYTHGWTYVENVYSIVKGSLTCDGNGGDNGRTAGFARCGFGHLGTRFVQRRVFPSRFDYGDWAFREKRDFDCRICQRFASTR